MKKLMLISTFFLFGTTIFAQEKTTSTSTSGNSNSGTVNQSNEKLFHGSEDLKSGNYKDVLFSFFQLGVKDLTGENKSFAFNSTLFALKVKGDPALLQDKSFLAEKFSRNLQFNFKLNLDTSYKFKGFTGGVTYAIINDRDRKVANFRKTVFEEAFNIYRNTIATEMGLFIGEVTNPAKYTSAQRDTLLNQLNEGQKYFDATRKTDKYPPSFLTYIGNKNLPSLAKRADSLRSVLLEKIDKSWLWTVSANASTDKASKLNSGAFSTILLNGNSPELDVRGTLSYTDTMVVTKISQVRVAASAGLNMPIIKSNRKNILELKAYMSYESVLKNILPTQDKNLFMGNADLRLKVTEKIWLPFTVKYDIKNRNFLGFLNVSFNLDAFKKEYANGIEL